MKNLHFSITRLCSLTTARLPSQKPPMSITATGIPGNFLIILIRVKLTTGYGYMRSFKCVSVCVCVKHLKRCKTFNFFLGRGAVNLIPSAAPRRKWFEIVISGLIIRTYLQSRSFFGNDPPCRFSTSWMSPLFRYGFRNLINFNLQF